MLGRLKAGLVAGLALFWASGALACSVCLSLPEQTAIDKLLNARVVVLARPQAQDSYRYTIKQRLFAAPNPPQSLPEIPHLIDNNTRSLLLENPENTVLFAYAEPRGSVLPRRSGQKPGANQWQRLFVLTPTRRAFVEQLWQAAQDWPESGQRGAFFAAYLSHEDHLLSDLALSELDRLPYAQLRQITAPIPTQRLAWNLRRMNRLAYVSVSLRLIGLSDDTEMRARLKETYPLALQRERLNLYAWALAGIELDRAAALPRIEARLMDPASTAEHRRDLLRALSDAGEAFPTLRTRMIPVFSNTLSTQRDTLAQIALTMTTWQERSLDDQFQIALSQGPLDPAARYMLRLHLAD